jgi:phytanoyl-CoA hydroxylase
VRQNGGVIDVEAYRQDGYAIVRGCVSVDEADALVAAAADLAVRQFAGESIEPAFVTAEANLLDAALSGPADAVSKVFRVHQRSPFADLAHREDIVDLAAAVLGTDDVDCFLSQFIFKNAGAWGQPCHQDSYYFPFTPARPVVGVWVAATDARYDNGCLYVVPGSHTEPVHTHVPDRRPDANLGYYEIIDHDLSNAVGVEMEPGDVLLFDSHLMHFSTDNESTRRRCAMVYHYAPAGTVDHTQERRGFTINDWVPVRRAS